MTGRRIDRITDADIDGLYDYCDGHGLEVVGLSTDASEDAPEPRLRLVLRKLTPVDISAASVTELNEAKNQP